MMKATNEQITELANTIAVQAESLKDVTGFLNDDRIHALALRLRQNAEVLEEWTKRP